MAFRNPVVAGTYLVRAAIQSPNYVAGSAGWSINRDGTSEFNAGTFRGAIEVGSLTGQHFWVNNPNTSDVIDIYNSSNNLVMTVDRSGNVTTIDPSSLDQTSMFGNGISWKNQTDPPYGTPRIYGVGNSTTANTISLNTGPATSNSWPAELTLTDSTGNSGAGAGIVVYQRGKDGIGTGTIGGTIVQTDNLLPQNNVIHLAVYNVTTSGTLGMATFNHNCGFTPLGGVVGPLTHFTQWNWNNSFGTNGFTSSQAQITLYQPSGAALTSGSAASFYAIFWG